MTTEFPDCEGSAQLLLVDDNPFDANLLMAWIERAEMDWDITHCMSLGDALHSLKSSKPCLIITDLGLPDASGLQVVKAFVEASAEVPLIVLEDSVQLDLATAALEIGAEDYINRDEISEDILRRAMQFAITRHNAQRRLRTLEGSLADADDELEEYASMVAHDLRAPLRTSRLLSQTLTKYLPNGMGHELAQRLDSTLGHLDSVVLSMLDYSSLRDWEPEIESVEVSSVVDAVLEGLEADIDEADAVLHLRVDPDTTVAATPAGLWRILENLLSNSIRYRSDDRPLEIEIECEKSEDSYRITVHDNGIGIPQTERDRVMRPMERIDTRLDGSGFGLAICKRQINVLGGQIWITNRSRANGTSVTFELPAAGAVRTRR